MKKLHIGIFLLFCVSAYGQNNFFLSHSITLPSVATTEITEITASSATAGGTITSTGGGIIITKGICWNTSPAPTVENNTISGGSGSEKFSILLNGLSSNTIYYVRAYVLNRIGIEYGDEVIFTTAFPNCGTVTDADGNIYNTVKIGTQCWMAENLRIGECPVYNDYDWGQMNLSGAPGVCVDYQNNPSNSVMYGKLYTWMAVYDGNLCPTGWHVPSDGEWTTLATFLGGEKMAGGKLKEAGTIHWPKPNSGATNETGFSAIPTGFRYDSGGFSVGTMSAQFWSTTGIFNGTAYYRTLNYESVGIGRNIGDMGNAFSVRCLKY